MTDKKRENIYDIDPLTKWALENEWMKGTGATGEGWALKLLNHPHTQKALRLEECAKAGVYFGVTALAQQIFSGTVSDEIKARFENAPKAYAEAFEAVKFIRATGNIENPFSDSGNVPLNHAKMNMSRACDLEGNMDQITIGTTKKSFNTTEQQVQVIAEFHSKDGASFVFEKGAKTFNTENDPRRTDGIFDTISNIVNSLENIQIKTNTPETDKSLLPL